jgi:hypothetical protein
MARLVHEYEMSIRQAKLTQQLPIPESLQEKRALLVRNIINPKNRRKMGLKKSKFASNLIAWLLQIIWDFIVAANLPVTNAEKHC